MENIDHLFKSALGGSSEAPPPEVWDALEKRLDGEDKRRPGFAFRWFWVALSLCCVIAIGSAVAWKMHSNNNAVVASRTDDAAPAMVVQAQSGDNSANASGSVSGHAATEGVSKSESTEKEKTTSATTTKQPTTDSHIADNTTTEQPTEKTKTVYHDPQNFNPATTRTTTDENRTSEPVEYVVNSSTRGNIMVAETETTQPTTGPRVQEPLSEPEFNDEPKAVKHTAVHGSSTGLLAMAGGNHAGKKHNKIVKQSIHAPAVAVNNNNTKTVKKATTVKRTHTDKVKEANTLAASVHLNTSSVKKIQAVNTPAANNAVAKKVEPVVKKDQTQQVVAQSSEPKTTQGVSKEAVPTIIKQSAQPVIKEPVAAAKTAQAHEKKNIGTLATADNTQQTATPVVADKGAVVKKASGKKVTTPATAIATTKSTSETHTIASAVKKESKTKRINKAQPVASNIVASTVATEKKYVTAPATAATAPTAKATNETQTVVSAIKKEPKTKKINKVQPVVSNTIASTIAPEKKKVTKQTTKTVAKQTVVSAASKKQPVIKTETAANTPVAVKHADAKKTAVTKKNDAGSAIAAVTKQTTHTDKKKKETVKNSKPQVANTDITANTNNNKKNNNTNNNKKKNNATPQPQPAVIAGTQQPVAPIASAPTAPVTKPTEVAANPSAASSTSSQMKAASPAVLPAKDTSANAAAAGTAASDSNAKKPFWKKYKFEAGVKAGFETGFSSTAANKVVVSPYIEMILSPKMSLMIQPAFKTSFVRNIKLNGNQNFYSPNGDSTVNYVTSTLIFLPGNTDTLIKRDYHYSQSKDSITKTYAAAAGHYQEYDLPLLFKYALTPKLSVYGGVNLTYSRYAYTAIKENTNELRVGAVADNYTITNLHSPVPTPPPTDSTIRFTGNLISTYAGPLYPPPLSGGLFRLGYMLGFSYEYKKRWMIDMLMQQGSAKANTQGGLNLNKALSANYFRFTLGYKLKK